MTVSKLIKNFDKLAHNVGKYRDTKKKHECSDDSFAITSGVVVTESHGGQRSKREISCDQSQIAIREAITKLKFGYKVVIGVLRPMRLFLSGVRFMFVI